MKYTLANDNFNDFYCFEDNALKPRAYFVPFKDMEECKKTTYLEERYNSSLVDILNGEWDFKFFGKISDMPLDIDTEEMVFDKVKVPGCWQYQGYEKPFYINTRYMFDIRTIPLVPADKGYYGKDYNTQSGPKVAEVYNSVGIYRKKFNIKKSEKNIISFLGVSSCLQLYVNGFYVGYAEGSHNTHEFDITNYLNEEGEDNELVALVYKWCNGTFLECQDMFRSNGIFRDVYITGYGKTYVWDYKCVSKRSGSDEYKLTVDVDSVKQEGEDVVCQLYLGDKLIDTKIGDKCEFSVSNPKLWSAEIPNLYTLYIQIKKGEESIECIRQEVGFRHIEINGNVFYLNDMPIKIKGVNHHDTHETNGYVMTAEELKADITLMKELNVNAVRTSHYPPDPIMLKIANYEGIYMIDEADIETHGCYGVQKTIALPNRISNNKRWKHHFWDRVYRMYMRDKNNVSVTMWSLGNESGGWKNQDYCYAKLKELDSVPIHYEAVCRTPRFNYDVVSQMYASTEFYEKYNAGKAAKKFYRAPYFQCEYAHAMGVGPGSLDFYVEKFYAADGALGGCIWEWADHAVKTDKGYLYGGDNGEYGHDSNFCVDGLVSPDRKPSVSALNMQAAYRPVKAYYISPNKYLLKNLNRFLSTSYLDIKWQYFVNGEVVSQGDLDIDILPMCDGEAHIKHPAIDTAKECYIDFIYYDKNTGKFVAKEQIMLSRFIKKCSKPEGAKIICVEENGKLKITTEAAKIMFSTSTGKLISYKVDEKEFLLTDKDARIFVPNIYRAPIDNYMYIRNKWHKLGFDDVTTKLVDFYYEKDGNSIKVYSSEDMLCGGKKRFTADIEYTVYCNGAIGITTWLTKDKAYDIPKYGLDFEVSKEYNNVTYYGRGDAESYSDMAEHATMGIYSLTADKMYTGYIKPQDNGNRSEVRWAKVTNDEGDGFMINGDAMSFNFNINRYTDKDIAEAMHDFELVERDKNIVRIDGFVRGVGSNSCGPDARAEFRHASGDDIQYSFRISPIIAKK